MSNQHTTEKSLVHYIKNIEQTERWRREFIQKKEYEVNLAAVSKLSYEEMDYTPLLETAPFPELTLTDYNYLYEQTAQRIEDEFKIPIALRLGMFIVLGVVLIAFISIAMLAVITVLSGILAASLVHTRKEKKESLLKGEQLVKNEIDKRHDEETRAYNEARANYEKTERERIESIHSLLAGNQNSIGGRLIEAFKPMQLPVLVEVDIEYYNNVPLAKVYLPAKSVITQQTCELLPSGRLQYKDKELRVYHKQYFELVTAIVMRISLTILENIPSFEYCYAQGISKEEDVDKCLLALKLTRENAVYANRVGTALNALQFVDVKYDVDTNFNMSFIDAEPIEEWGDANLKSIFKITIKIFK